MSISVTIPIDALNDPRVAKALSDLMLSLGGVSPARVTGLPDGDKRRSATPSRRRRSTSKAPFGEGLTEEQRYAAFIKGLPAPSRRFLDLIRSNGTVSLSRAIDELGITVPKAIGGITGSLSRWARDRNVELPFRADKSDSGERIWIWTRGTDDAAAGKTAAAEPKPKKSRKKAKVSDSTTPTEPIENGLAALLEGQTDTAREFLSLLSQRGELTMSEALKSFGLKHAQAIGAVIRSFRKRAKERDLVIPFEEKRSRTGERMWTWTGLPEESAGDEEEPARSGSGVLVRKRGRDTATPV